MCEAFYKLICFLIQKLAKSLSVSYGIEPGEEGSAGLRLTARGSITTCTYRMDTYGRTHLNSVWWKRFLDGKNLRVGQAILITIRNTHRPGLRMMTSSISSRTTYVCVAISSRTTYDDRRRYHLKLHMMIVVDIT